jgi:ArsR family metal-binding transcriptional regulator
MTDDPEEEQTGNPLEVNDQRKFTIVEYSPLLICLGDPAKFRVVARLSPSPKDILTMIDPLFEKATYSKKMDALLIKQESTLITVYASGIVTMTRLNSGIHGRQILQDIIDRINDVFTSGTIGDIRHASRVRKQVDPMEINGPLPHSNCGKCGYKSCFYFATMLAFSETSLDRCTPLLKERYAANRVAVAQMINSNNSG